MTVRAKFYCASKTVNAGKEVTYKFFPVTSGNEENKQFFKYTPSGLIDLGIVNPSVEFIPGEEYYVDFTLVEHPAKPDPPTVEPPSKPPAKPA